MIHTLRASGLVMVTGRRLPFMVDSAGLDAVMDLDTTRDVHVRLDANTIFSGVGGFIMTMRWDEDGQRHVAVFFVYFNELRLGTLGVRRIQRAWRAHRSFRRRLALCMGSLGADPHLRRMLRVLCAQDLMRLA